jgi:mRNA interferase RelE/StbE
VTGLWRLDVPPHVAEVIRTLPPQVKHAVKEALRLLARNPEAGEPLRGELHGLWKYRVRRFRIVYERVRRVVRVVAVGHRRTIYEAIGEQSPRFGRTRLRPSGKVKSARSSGRVPSR